MVKNIIRRQFIIEHVLYVIFVQFVIYFIQLQIFYKSTSVKNKNYIYINSNDIKSFTLCKILFLITFMGLTSVDYSLLKIKFRYLYILIQSILNNQLIVLKR